jgi:DNA-binding MarR family transcriptional regulator
MPYNRSMEENITSRFRTAYWALVHNMDIMRLRTWEERGITLPQLRILFVLRAHPGTTTHRLAKLLGLTAPTVSGLVDKLVRAGLVARGQHPDDRRIIPLELTDEGRGLVGAISEHSQAYLNELAAELGPDLESATRALERLAAAVARHPAPGAAPAGARP